MAEVELDVTLVDRLDLLVSATRFSQPSSLQSAKNYTSLYLNRDTSHLIKQVCLFTVSLLYVCTLLCGCCAVAVLCCAVAVRLLCGCLMAIVCFCSYHVLLLCCLTIRSYCDLFVVFSLLLTAYVCLSLL